MSVNWGLGLAPDVAGSAFGSFMKGQDDQRVDSARNAMTAYVTNPNDQTLNALAPHNPGLVLQQRQEQAAKQAAQEERILIGDALTHPDPVKRQEARQRLAYTNSEQYLKLGEQDRKKVDASMKALSQMAYPILKLPRDQQGPALQRAVQQLEANGYDVSGFQFSGDAERDLKTVLAIAGDLDNWEKDAEVKYIPKTEYGMMATRWGVPMGDIPAQQGAATPPPAAVEELRRNPGSAAQFDEIFGPGAAQRALGGAGSNASGGFPE